MVPLPPALNITQIGCISPHSLIEFKPGWYESSCPIRASYGGGNHVSLYLKGDNLTPDLVKNSINGVFINQNETSIEFSVNALVTEEDVILVDIFPSETFSGTDSIEFLINGVRSALIPLRAI